MRKLFDAGFSFVLAVVFIVIGVIGLILPVLPGIPFIVLALVVLSRHFGWAKRLLDKTGRWVDVGKRKYT